MKPFSAVIASLLLVASFEVNKIVVEAAADAEDPAKEKLSIGALWHSMAGYPENMAGVSWYTGNDANDCSPNTDYRICIKSGKRSEIGFRCRCKNCKEFTVKSDSSGEAGPNCTKWFPHECGVEHTVIVKIKGKRGKWARDKRSFIRPCADLF